MDDLEVIYDGNEHFLEINEELPDGVTVEYTNNNQVNAGEYVVEANFKDTTGNYITPNECGDYHINCSDETVVSEGVSTIESYTFEGCTN